MADNQVIRLGIMDLLSSYDLDGIEFFEEDEQIQRLEGFIEECNREIAEKGTPIVVDAIYDRLCDILREVNPDSDILRKLWNDSGTYDDITEDDMSKDYFRLLHKYPMMSIRTCKSYDCSELDDFIKILPDGAFDIHASLKENGHGVRLVYEYGDLVSATSRMRSSGGHDITNQLKNILSKQGLCHIAYFEDYPIIEVRGEVVLPLAKLEEARVYKPEIVSPFTGVSSMLRDSASADENKLLDFVAYRVLCDMDTLIEDSDYTFSFDSKTAEYDYLSSIGFIVPLFFTVSNITRDTFREEIETIVKDFGISVTGDTVDDKYEYFTDGIVVEVDDRELFDSMGSDGSKYNYGNVALKVGYWQQDMYVGYVQTILWTSGKVSLSPVAIVADEPNKAEDINGCDIAPYVFDTKEISNFKDLGVLTINGNKVRRVPLYEPNNIVMLDAYAGGQLNFRFGGEAGVVPCFPDGTLLSNTNRVKSLTKSDEYDEYTEEEYIDV